MSSSSSSRVVVGLGLGEEEEEEEQLEQTLLVVREVSVYKIPPRNTSGGYKCGEWLQSDKIWSGRLRVVSSRDRCCEIRLEDPNSGDLFAACFVQPGQRDASVETVLDSSRYFVLKIENGLGKHAFIGLGFAERNDAFDFNVALSDHDKYLNNNNDLGQDSDHNHNHIDIHPAVNHRLKEGETIRINVKNKPSAGAAGMLSSAGLGLGLSSANNSTLLLAPPPAASSSSSSSSGKIRSAAALPPPPNDPAAARMVSAAHAGPKDSRHSTPLSDSDLSSIQRNLPTSGSDPTKSTASGWAAF